MDAVLIGVAAGAGTVAAWLVVSGAAEEAAGTLVFLSRRIRRAAARVRDARRREEQWAEMLFFLAGSFKSGMPLAEALDLMISDAPEPLRAELVRRSAAAGRFAPLSTRIERLMPEDTLTLAKAALLLSHEAGGRTAAVMETAARLLRRRQEMARRAKALSAQGRMSAWVVGASPFALLAAMAGVEPEYLAPMVQTRTGFVLMGLVVAMVAAGLLLVHRVARVDP